MKVWEWHVCHLRERGSPTWTACVAEVKVDPNSGEVEVKKITVSMDVGTAVNPDGVRKQQRVQLFMVFL